MMAFTLISEGAFSQNKSLKDCGIFLEGADIPKDNPEFTNAVDKAKEFMDRYGGPELLDTFLIASRIKKELDRLGVAYSEKNHVIFIKPINKSGLNQFAYEMAKHRNFVVAFNMHAFSDSRRPSVDDYFQAHSDSFNSNLILSEEFLKEVVSSDDFKVNEWVENAKTYLQGYHKFNSTLLETVFQDSKPYDLAGLVIDHRQAMESLIYNVKLKGKVDRDDIEFAQNEVFEFFQSISKLENLLGEVVEPLDLNQLVSVRDFIPLTTDPILKNMELNLVPAGRQSYRALVRIGKGSTKLSFYLSETLTIEKPMSTLTNPHQAGFFGRGLLSNQERDRLKMHTRAHLLELGSTLRILRVISNKANIEDFNDVLAYNQRLLTNSSLSNRAYIY